MTAVLRIKLGKRTPQTEKDNSCSFGVVFGSELVEVDINNVTLCYTEIKSDDVTKRRCGVFVHQIGPSGEFYEEAYRDISHERAVKLERLLRDLIENRISAAEYETKRAAIEE